jgi:hypothetical protein
MINPHSVVAFFHKAEWTKLAITHEINRMLGENTITYSTVGKYVREFICRPKDKDSVIIRQFEGDFLLKIGLRLCLRRHRFFRSVKSRRR